MWDVYEVRVEVSDSGKGRTYGMDALLRKSAMMMSCLFVCVGNWRKE